jgi:DNA-binding MarR family transcriptional regulator
MGDAANRYLADLGITAAERAIMEFLIRDQKLTVPDIAKRYKVSRQHVQVTVNSLLEKKLVISEENPGHRRSALLRLSPGGKRLFRRIGRHDEGLLNKVFEGIADTDARKTRKTLETMLSNLNKGAEQ